MIMKMPRFIAAVALGLASTSADAQLISRQVQPLGPPPYMFAGTGLEIGQFVSLFTPTSANAFQASKQAIWTPDYAVYNCRLFYPNWVMRGSLTLSQEVDGTQPITIERDTLQAGGAGTPIDVTFSGSLSTTLAAGGGIWSDPLAVTFQPRTKLINNVATAAQVAASSMFGMFQPNASLGEAFQTSSTSLASAAASGTIANTGSASLFAYGASAMVCQGYDGRPVSLVYGDSIGTGTGEANNTSDDRGNKGWLARGLDSTASSSIRLPFAKWTAPSAAAKQITTSADFARRFAMISALPNVPFTHIAFQMGLNDATGSAGTWETRISTAQSVLKTQYPNQKLIQFGFTPYTTVDTAIGTTAASQTYVVSHDWPTGFTQQVQNYYAGLPTNVDGFMFIEDWFDNSTTRCGGSGSGTQGKWRVDQTFTTTLGSATGTNATTLLLPLAPTVGAALAVNPSGTGAATTTVTNVTGGVGGNYTVTVFPAIATAMSSGVTVREVGSQDFLHPSSTSAASVAACFAAVKSTVFR